jgi:hypothetical protein
MSRWLGPNFCGFVVKGGGALSKKTRTELLAEARGESEEFIHSFAPFTNSWFDYLSARNEPGSENKVFADMNASLGLVHGDLIVLGTRPDTFTVKPFEGLSKSRVDPLD